MSYQPHIDTQVPMAVPIKQDYPLAYSTAAQIQRVSVNAAATLYWINGIKSADGNIYQMIVCTTMILGTIGALLLPMFETKPLIGLYSSDTIRDSAMCSNIVDGFRSRAEKYNPFTAFQFHFRCPSISPDIKHAYNTFLMVFYEVCGSVYSRLDNIDNKIASLERSVAAIQDQVNVIEYKQDQMQDQMHGMQDQMNHMQDQMTRVLMVMETILANQNHTNDILDRFSFVVE